MASEKTRTRLRDRAAGVYVSEWDDLRFPAGGDLIWGFGGDPDNDGTKVGLLFDAAATETVYAVAQMPHGWKEGSIVHPHIHWEKTTSASGNVLWQVEYALTSHAQARTGFTTITSSTPVTSSDTLDVHQITVLPDIAMTGRLISAMILCKVSRVGGDAADTYGADARMLEFDIHHEIDSRGSVQEFVK